MAKAKVHVINFQPQDIESAIARLSDLNDTGELAGLLFVAKLRNKKRPLIGAAGCCVHDRLSAMGAAAYLMQAVTELASEDR